MVSRFCAPASVLLAGVKSGQNCSAGPLAGMTMPVPSCLLVTNTPTSSCRPSPVKGTATTHALLRVGSLMALVSPLSVVPPTAAVMTRFPNAGISMQASWVGSGVASSLASASVVVVAGTGVELVDGAAVVVVSSSWGSRIDPISPTTNRAAKMMPIIFRVRFDGFMR